MPVLDHEIHESVRKNDSNRYGCWNRKGYAEGYHVHDRAYKTDGTYVMRDKFIKYVMSRECRFDMSLTDKWCEGCKHRGSGEAYNEMVKTKGA